MLLSFFYVVIIYFSMFIALSSSLVPSLFPHLYPFLASALLRSLPASACSDSLIIERLFVDFNILVGYCY